VHDVCTTNGRVWRARFPGCRPPILVRVAPEGNRMLATSARMADACPALLICDTGFHTKGAGAGPAGCACMTSAIRMAESGELAFPACPSASWLQAPNASARCTRRVAYAAGFSYSLYLSPSPIAGARGQGVVPWKQAVQRRRGRRQPGRSWFSVRHGPQIWAHQLSW